MLDIDGVENVFLYIADDVRADFTPDRVANLGQYHRTIAAGIHSPTSISSILTGTYEPQHGVGDFSNVVPSDVPHLVNDELCGRGGETTCENALTTLSARELSSTLVLPRNEQGTESD